MTTLTAASSHFAMHFARDAILLIACLPLAYYLVATLAGLRFVLRQREKSPGSFTPEVSVLKPVRSVDFASYENFRSFCLQDYPKYEILFCVNDLDDAAVPLIRRLAEEFPQRSIRLLSDAPQLGSNHKVNNLALLASQAKFELLVQSDGDVRVGANYLREMAAPFERAEAGVVSCFYRGVTQKNLWAEIEALGVATDFSAGVLVADWMEGVTFALGASVATTKTWLGKIGGYEGLAKVLADDYEIGNRVTKAGGRAMLSREVVETMYPAQTFAEFWAHQMRWARTVRLCRPAAYVGLLFTYGLPLAIARAIVSRSPAVALLLTAGYVGLRLAVAGIVGVWGLRDKTTRRRWWLLPLRDLLQFAVWVASFFSNRIIWGDAEFELSANGEMAAIGKVAAKQSAEKPLRTG